MSVRGLRRTLFSDNPEVVPFTGILRSKKRLIRAVRSLVLIFVILPSSTVGMLPTIGVSAATGCD
jgi:hypothetical protein